MTLQEVEKICNGQEVNEDVSSTLLVVNIEGFVALGIIRNAMGISPSSGFSMNPF
jgi:hypothetical protein